MENGVVHVENSEWIGELGGVPVVVGGENGRLGVRIHSEDVGLDRLICRNCKNLRSKTA